MKQIEKFKWAWEKKYLCPKCSALMVYKPETIKETGGTITVNWWNCSECEFVTKGVFDLIKTAD